MGRKQREEEQQERKLKKLQKRRNFLKITTGSLVLGFVGYFGIRIFTQEPITFLEACKNEELREEYVQQFEPLLVKYPFVKSIKYDPSMANEQVGHMITTVLDQPPKKNELEPSPEIGKKTNIFIAPTLFESNYFQTENDFLSGLIDHEIEGHAKSMYYGFDGFNPDNATDDEGMVLSIKVDGGREAYSTSAILELFAYENQIKKSQNRKINDEMHFANRDNYIKHYLDMIRLHSAKAYKNEEEIINLEIRFARKEFLKLKSTVPYYTGPTFNADGKVYFPTGVVTLDKRVNAHFDKWR